MAGLDTVDIEDFASRVKVDFVAYWTNFLYSAIVAEAPAIAASPFFSWALRHLLEKAVAFAAGEGGQVAFMLNTRVFTTDQAKDYVAAATKVIDMPEDVSDKEWERGEAEANRAFRNLYNFTK